MEQKKVQWKYGRDKVKYNINEERNPTTDTWIEGGSRVER